MASTRQSPPRYVVDASVVVKWFSKFSEEDAAKSGELMNSHIQGRCVLMSSPLVLYELSNALRFNPNFGIALSQVSHVPLAADYKLLTKIKGLPFIIPLKEMEL